MSGKQLTKSASTENEATLPSREVLEGLFCECEGFRLPERGRVRCAHCQSEGSFSTVEGFVVVNKQKERSPSVIEEDYYPGPKTNHVNCPNCGHDEAQYRLQQIRSADESETRRFTRVKCDDKWREDDH